MKPRGARWLLVLLPVGLISVRGGAHHNDVLEVQELVVQGVSTDLAMHLTLSGNQARLTLFEGREKVSAEIGTCDNGVLGITFMNVADGARRAAAGTQEISGARSKAYAVVQNQGANTSGCQVDASALAIMVGDHTGKARMYLSHEAGDRSSLVIFDSDREHGAKAYAAWAPLRGAELIVGNPQTIEATTLIRRQSDGEWVLSVHQGRDANRIDIGIAPEHTALLQTISKKGHGCSIGLKNSSPRLDVKTPEGTLCYTRP